ALRCLEAELKHRERALRQARASDLAEYRRLASDGIDHGSNNQGRNNQGRNNQGGIGQGWMGEGPLQPLPRLVIVIDEFATLATELPEFIDALIGVAQRGRSLGVHLILATQRPSGAVSDNIRANTNIRIALRVQDAAESCDVVGTPDAAALDRRTPGRAVLRLGPSELVVFQAARVSQPTPGPRGEPALRLEPFRLFDGSPGPPWLSPVDDPADPAAEAAGVPPVPRPSEPSDLARIVAAARSAFALRGGRPPRAPWPTPLPPILDRADVVDGRDGADGISAAEAVILGLADEPDAQRQEPYRWDPSVTNLLVVGPAGSGTTSAIVTAALALATRRRPDQLHLYVMDFGSQSLAPLARLPHCGGVVAAGDAERQERLIRMLGDSMDRRRGTRPPDGAWPRLVVLIDNYGGLHHAWDDVARLQWRDDLARIVADGPGLGISVVISADRPGSVPVSVSSSIVQKLLFRTADPYDLAAFGISPNRGPAAIPGRAVDAATGRHVQLVRATPTGLDGLAAAVEALRAKAPAGPGTAPGESCRGAASGHVDEPGQVPAAGPACGQAGKTVPEGAAGRMGAQPLPIHRLPSRVAHQEVGTGRLLSSGELILPVGIGDRHLAPACVRLGDGEHLLVAGPARSGKSSVLVHLASKAAEAGLMVSAAAPRRSPLRSAGLAHVATEAGDIVSLFESSFEQAAGPDRRRLLLVDDAELVDDPSGDIDRILSARRPGLHVVAAGRSDVLRTAFGHWTAEVRRSRQGLVLRPQPELDGELWHVSLPRRSPTQWTAGRGYLVIDGEVELVQAVETRPA
ncbi:MAG TPA: FtsK/SpoIIIE domain-containing protein, partial [Acidimicrobiales bacterium]